MLRRLGLAGLSLALSWALAACDSKRIDVIGAGEDEGAQQGRQSFLKAISEFRDAFAGG